jgi:D-3-phosphoglycerate dehydrogenase
MEDDKMDKTAKLLKVVFTGNMDLPRLPANEEEYRLLGARFVKKAPCPTEEAVIAEAGDADAVIALRCPYNRRVIEKLSRCRLISVPSAGYEWVDVDAATEHGICVTNVPNPEEVSDHAMALLLACARKISLLNDAVKKGWWDSLEKPKIMQLLPPISRLRGQCLGIIGLGRIGRSLVPKAQGFGLKVIAYDPYLPSAEAEKMGVKLVELDELLSESDFVSIHTLLNPQTYHLLGEEQFKKMKPTAYLINAARGAIIDEAALYTALSRGYIAGAALDVMDTEPPAPDNPLLKMDNIVITAHTAYYSQQAFAQALRQTEEEVFRILRGEWPLNLVNPEVRERFNVRWQSLT